MIEIYGTPEIIEEQFRAQHILLWKQEELLQKLEQENCSHIAGSNKLSHQHDIYGRTSIVWHTLRLWGEVGICTNCFRQFWPSEEDYVFWRSKKSFNKSSQGNQEGTKVSAEEFQEAMETGQLDYVPNSVLFSKDFNEKWGW